MFNGGVISWSNLGFYGFPLDLWLMDSDKLCFSWKLYTNYSLILFMNFSEVLIYIPAIGKMRVYYQFSLWLFYSCVGCPRDFLCVNVDWLGFYNLSIVTPNFLIVIYDSMSYCLKLPWESRKNICIIFWSFCSFFQYFISLFNWLLEKKMSVFYSEFSTFFQNGKYFYYSVRISLLLI